MPLVELTGISKRFGEECVLNDLDLICHEGEYLIVLGSSGCGKSTLLKVIAGLTSPDNGSVRLDGQESTGKSPRQRDVSFLFQSDALYPHMTVRKSIRSGIANSTLLTDQNQLIESAAAMVGITELLDRLPETLSGGERRRAALAKAIARGAKIRLLDEPLSAVDAHLTHRIQDDLLRWHQSCSGATIHVTHDGQEALRMADRIAILNQGRIVQIDTPDSVCKSPATVSAAESLFIKPLSVLSYTHDQSQDTQSSPTNTKFQFTDASPKIDHSNRVLGFRAEDAEIRNDECADDHLPGIYFRGTATHLKRMGDEVFAGLELDSVKIHTQRIFVRIPNDALAINEIPKNKLDCFVPESKLLWFEGEM